MSQPPIDQAVLQALEATTDADFARELVQTYLEDSESLLERLRLAGRAKSAADLRLAAHALKSSSATVGAAGVSRMAKELEAQAKAGQIGGSEAALAGLETEFARAREALEAWSHGE